MATVGDCCTVTVANVRCSVPQDLRPALHATCRATPPSSRSTACVRPGASSSASGRSRQTAPLGRYVGRLGELSQSASLPPISYQGVHQQNGFQWDALLTAAAHSYAAARRGSWNAMRISPLRKISCCILGARLVQRLHATRVPLACADLNTDAKRVFSKAFEPGREREALIDEVAQGSLGQWMRSRPPRRESAPVRAGWCLVRA